MDRFPSPGEKPHRLLAALPVSWKLETVLLAVTAAALVAGGGFWLSGSPGLADLCWGLGTLAAVAPAMGWVLAELRKGHAGVDLIAVLALGGTLAVHEYLAGALIALMLATGRTLEAAAQQRASHDLRALLEHAPRTARRRTGTEVRKVPLAEVAVGDLLVVGP
ncbi:MAG: heavy metal translocating P-type ATPase, partial [Streptomyces sp.]|nr:heavy metal translocating P-type ATPase [Streptomyces sp.]